MITTYRTVMGLAPALRSLFLTTILFRAGTIAYPFLAAYLLVDGSLNAGQVGIVVGAYGAGALVADLVSGIVITRLGLRATMVTGLGLNAAVVALLPALSGVELLWLGTLLWGFGYELFTPASYAAITTHVTDDDRKVAFSCHRLAINVGMAVGPLIGGVLFALTPTSVFAANAAMLVVAALCLLVTYPATTGSSIAEDDETPTRRRWWSSTRRAETRFWTYAVLSFPIHVAFALPPTFLSAYVVTQLDLPAYVVGVIFAVNAVLIVACEVPLNVRMKDLPTTTSMLWGYGFTVLGFACMGLLHQWPGLIAATVLWSIAEMIVFPALMSYAAEVSERQMVARNMGLYAAGVNLGLVVAAPLSLLLATDVGAGVPWLAAAGATLVAAAVIVGVRRLPAMWLPRDEASAA